MSNTYVIGDVQGCYTALCRLLEKIHYSDSDCLWFTGDLVNRGPDSAQTLRLVKSLKNKITVLGNHDLGLLVIAAGYAQQDKGDTLDNLLKANDREELLAWLQQQPLFYREKDFILTHAGVYPFWTIEEAQRYAQEVEQFLRGPQASVLLSQLYGNQPNRWSENLTGYERLRFICNSFTRMRFCHADGVLDLHEKTNPSEVNTLIPWFRLSQLPGGVELFFGHWAALNGVTHRPDIHALDTGYIWGNSLTAMRLEDKETFSVNAPSHT